MNDPDSNSIEFTFTPALEFDEQLDEKDVNFLRDMRITVNEVPLFSDSDNRIAEEFLRHLESK